MFSNKVIRPFFCLEQKENQNTSFFFLEQILKTRIALHVETGQNEFDQEINVYIAGLLNSLVASESFVKQKPYISAFDLEIRKWLENHPGLRNEYVVYRDNADFGLIQTGLFPGYEHPGSYHHIVLADTDDRGRIALYYEMAASALMHLQGCSNSLVNIFMSLADNISVILTIIRHTATSYFDFIEKISDGSFYHLEKEIDDLDKKINYQRKLDEFLKLYGQYKENPDEDLKSKVMDLARELKILNDQFLFNEL